MHDISPTPASAYMRATGINEFGTIVGITNATDDYETSDLPARLTDGSFVYEPDADATTPLPMRTAVAVNDDDIVAGMRLHTTSISPCGVQTRGVFHDLNAGTTTDIPLPGQGSPISPGQTVNSTVGDLNSVGTVVGAGWYEALGQSFPPCTLSRAYQYATSPPATGTGGGGASFGFTEIIEPQAINDAGTVVAYGRWVEVLSAPIGQPQFGPLRTLVGSTLLPNLGGGRTIGHDINNHGLVVGESGILFGGTRAFVWDPATGEMTDLGTLGGSNSRAFAISDNGVVVGEAEDENGVMRPFRVQVAVPATTGDVGGTVTNHDGDPVAGARVVVYDPDDRFVGSFETTTDANGRYSFFDLPPDQYRAYFIPPDGSDLLREWFDDATTRHLATFIDVTAGSANFDVDAQLAGPASISGIVLGPGGAPTAGVKVQAYRSTDTWVGSYVTTTGVDGTYDLAGLAPGSYKIYFTPTADTGLQKEWYDDATTRGLAANLTVTAGGGLTGIDAQLE
jgi:probable HAF family extracellular repeat protein